MKTTIKCPQCGTETEVYYTEGEKPVRSGHPDRWTEGAPPELEPDTCPECGFSFWDIKEEEQ